MNDLLDWLQDGRFVDRSEAGPLIRALEDLDDQARSSGPGGLDLGALRRAAESQNPHVRKMATLAMARFGDPESSHNINQLLADECAAVRQAAADTAGSLEQEKSAPALISLLDNTQEQAEVRRAAALALGRIRHPAAPAALARALADPDPDIRRVAVKATANIRPLDGAAPPVGALCSILGDETPAIRGLAADALGKLGDPAARDPLAKALADANTSVRGRAALALGRLGDKRAVPSLISLLRNAPTPEAAEILGKLADPRAVDALCTALSNDEPSVRRAAADSLRLIGDLRALRPLRNCAGKEQGPDVAEAVAAALAELESKLPSRAGSQDRERPTQTRPPQSAARGRAPDQDLPPAAAEETRDVFERIDQAATELNCRIEETDNGRTLAVPVPGGHEQTVTATAGERDGDGMEIVRVRSVCGPADSGNYRNALLLNRHLVFGAVSVKKERAGETFELCEAILARDATVVTLRKIISYVAASANQIARQLHGE